MNDTGVWRNLYAELRRRKVFRVATIYVITMWPVIQLADILQPTLGFSDAVLSTLLYCFVAGFPLALALAWLYDLTREGIVRTGDEPDSARAPLLNRTAEAIVIGALTVLVLALFLAKLTLAPDEPAQDAPAAARPAMPVPAGIESIAVLPFTSFSTSEDDRVFADGLTEELLNVLSRMKQLRVAARTSSFAYKDVNRNIQEVGSELGVARILEGSVRRNDVSDTIRVTAQLVDVATGAHLWSQTYDREYRDVFRIQDEIASAVAAHLSVTLLASSAQVQTAAGDASPDAFLALSRGRAALARRSPASIGTAVTEFEQAVAASPLWAEAHAALAEACVLTAIYTGGDTGLWLGKAQAAVDEALRLDPRLGAAWASQGLIHMQFDERKGEARTALAKAIELNPSYAMAYMWLGSLQDEPAARLRFHRHALELDPRSAVAAYNVANDLLDAGEEEEAMAAFEKIVAADPFYPGAYRLIARINALHGRLDDALADYLRAYDLEPDTGVSLDIARLYATLGLPGEARRWLERTEGSANANIALAHEWFSALTAYAADDLDAMRAHVEGIARNPPPGISGLLNSALAFSLNGAHELAVLRFEEATRRAREAGWKIGHDTLLDPYTFVIGSYLALGRDAEAARVLGEVRSYVDARVGASRRANPDLWYLRAVVEIRENKPDLALATLQRALDEGWTEAWRLRMDPVFEPLHANERFIALERSLLARLAIMRESVAAEGAERGRGP